MVKKDWDASWDAWDASSVLTRGKHQRPWDAHPFFFRCKISGPFGPFVFPRFLRGKSLQKGSVDTPLFLAFPIRI